mmetsp:Transcript_23618/g.50990  ORF Transcript_23618/g.50990 Transcript_23618/m.50990 type:complete len:84 (+) Transcript_23618:917-1168(+)
MGALRPVRTKISRRGINDGAVGSAKEKLLGEQRGTRVGVLIPLLLMLLPTVMMERKEMGVGRPLVGFLGGGRNSEGHMYVALP